MITQTTHSAVPYVANRNFATSNSRNGTNSQLAFGANPASKLVTYFKTWSLRQKIFLAADTLGVASLFIFGPSAIECIKEYNRLFTKNPQILELNRHTSNGTTIRDTVNVLSDTVVNGTRIIKSIPYHK
jgi:hypothetical protein